MSGEWIKMRTNLWNDPRVSAVVNYAIAELVGRDDNPVHLSLDAIRCLVIGSLFRLWSITDEQSEDGTLPYHNAFSINDLVGWEGFAEMLSEVGWLDLRASGVGIPRFSEHNGQSAKSRARNTLRQQKCRAAVALSARQKRDQKKKKKKNVEEEALREKDHKNDPSCSEATEDVRSEPLMIFPTTGKTKQWELTQAKVEEFRQCFPDLDILGECRKALAWCINNPKRRKSPAGMGRFLCNWLTRAQEKGLAGKGPANGKTTWEQTLQEVQEQCQRMQPTTRPGSTTTPPSSDSPKPTSNS